MAEIILVTGGCRSGKSNYAEKLALEAGENKLYIATAPILDEEMKKRVLIHQKHRDGKGWDTIEEEINLSEIFTKYPYYDTFLVDCLTLWINNLIYYCEKNNLKIDENYISNQVSIILNIINKIDGRVIFVINEVGMGVVPENKLARLFRDLSGRCAQIIAKNANQVILMSCGLPLNLK